MTKKFHIGGIITPKIGPVQPILPADEFVVPKLIAEQMVDRFNNHMARAFGTSYDQITGTVKADLAPSESLTIAKLKEAMDKFRAIPPAPFFGSSVRFPADHALRFTHDGQDYALAHPDFWAKVKSSLPVSNTPPNFGAIEIIDLDLEHQERARERAFAALKQELPDLPINSACGPNPAGDRSAERPLSRPDR